MLQTTDTGRLFQSDMVCGKKENLKTFVWRCSIEAYIDTAKTAKIFRYVDDYMIVTRSVKPEEVNLLVKTVKKTFLECSDGLEFTHELPNDGSLQFLDVCFNFCGTRVCWAYQPRSKKAILDYRSAHSKIVKRGIGVSCLRGALEKSCQHQVADSVQHQVARLKDAGFPREVIAAVVESLLRDVKSGARRQGRDEPRKERRPVVVPYVHNFSNRLKKVAGKCGADVVFSAPEKLARMCSAVNGEKKGNRRRGMPRCLLVANKVLYTKCLYLVENAILGRLVGA